MDYFAPFVLTKSQEYYLDNAYNVDTIIESCNLIKDQAENNIVTAVLIAPENVNDVTDLNKWEFEVTQYKYPNWTYEGDSSLEERIRRLFDKIIQDQKIGKKIIAGSYQTANVGIFGLAETGDYGCSIAGDYGTAISSKSGRAISGIYGNSIVGDYGMAIVGNVGTATSKLNGISFAGGYATAISGYNGKSTAEDCGKAITGDYGTAKAGKYGTAIVGKYGAAIVDNMGKAKAGENGSITVQYFDEIPDRMRIITAYVGEDGIEPDTFYKVENCKLVKVEEKE